MRQSTANKRYVKRQMSVIRVYTCSERHLTFRRNIDTRRQWSVGNIGWNEWLYWEIVTNDHCPGSVTQPVYKIVYVKVQKGIFCVKWQIYTAVEISCNNSAALRSFAWVKDEISCHWRVLCKLSVSGLFLSKCKDYCSIEYSKNLKFLCKIYQP